MNIVLPDQEPFDEASLYLAEPQPTQGGGYFSFLMRNNGSPLYVQLPECSTKEGIVGSKRNSYCDLMYGKYISEGTTLWLEQFEQFIRNTTQTKLNRMNSEDSLITDIEEMMDSIIRPYNSGKNLCFRTYLDIDKNNESYKCATFDERGAALDISVISAKIRIIPIIHFEGVRLGSTSFKIVTKLKQIMVLDELPDILSTCLINRVALASNIEATDPVASNIEATEPVATEHVASNIEATEPVATDPVASNTEATEPVATDPVATEPVATEPVASNTEATESLASNTEATEPLASNTEATEPVATEPVASNTEASNTDINEPVASNTEGKNPYVIETNTTDIETTGTNATGTDIDTEISEPKINDNTKNGSLSGTFSQEVSLAKESPLTEVTLTEPDNEFIHVKNPNEVYYERYQKVRNEAKKLRRQALKAFLEAENLKINHCIEDTDEEEEF